MEFQVLDDPLKFYTLMLGDIARAKRYVYLETYKFANDHIGIKFRDALTKKANEGVDVKILIDSWGRGPVSESFFEDMVKFGGEVKFFEKIRLNTICGSAVAAARVTREMRSGTVFVPYFVRQVQQQIRGSMDNGVQFVPVRVEKEAA